MRTHETALRVAQHSADRSREPYIIYQVGNGQWLFAPKTFLGHDDCKPKYGTVEVVMPTEPAPIIKPDDLRVAIGECIFALRIAAADYDGGADLQPVTERVIEATQKLGLMATAHKRQEEAK